MVHKEGSLGLKKMGKGNGVQALQVCFVCAGMGTGTGRRYSNRCENSTV